MSLFTSISQYCFIWLLVILATGSNSKNFPRGARPCTKNDDFSKTYSNAWWNPMSSRYFEKKKNLHILPHERVFFFYYYYYIRPAHKYASAAHTCVVDCVIYIFKVYSTIGCALIVIVAIDSRIIRTRVLVWILWYFFLSHEQNYGIYCHFINVFLIRRYARAWAKFFFTGCKFWRC